MLVIRSSVYGISEYSHGRYWTFIGGGCIVDDLYCYLLLFSIKYGNSEIKIVIVSQSVGSVNGYVYFFGDYYVSECVQMSLTFIFVGY